MIRSSDLPAVYLHRIVWTQLLQTSIVFLVVLIFTGGIFVGQANAISDAQRDALNSGVYYFNTEDSSAACGSTTTTLTGSDNQQQAYNYFVQKGLTDYQAAGILGNLMQESHVDPTEVQPNGPGKGIAQWNDPGRWNGVENLATSEGVSPTTLGVQLDFMWQELNSSYAKALSDLKVTTNVVDATQSFETDYEAAGTPDMQNRINYAQQILTTYGSAVGAGATSVCGVDCTSTDATTSGLSQVRQSVVCIAQQELAIWTPPPAIPRLLFTKYTQGVVGTVAAPEEWCADFSSWVYNQAGYPLQSPNWRVPGVASIQTIGEQNQNFHFHGVAGYTPQPGDLAIHSGQHVNIVVGVNGNTVTLIGGDQGGGPYGGPTSASVVSTEIVNSFAGSPSDPITGYVSPD